jgi:hypothetical protein
MNCTSRLLFLAVVAYAVSYHNDIQYSHSYISNKVGIIYVDELQLTVGYDNGNHFLQHQLFFIVLAGLLMAGDEFCNRC